MSVWKLALLLLSGGGISAQLLADYQVTPYLQNVEYMTGVAEVDSAGAPRGPRWYDYNSKDSESELAMNSKSEGSSLSSGSESKKKKSSGASSVATKEKRLALRTYRECTPCPEEMIKKYNNLGIKWICGAYQSARRSFKSECMMRYRNCQDGTMFVKVSDNRCPDNAGHGKHWFYIYKV